MMFLTDATVMTRELMVAVDNIAIVEYYDKGARRFFPRKPSKGSKVVPMREVIPSLKRKARKETSELDREFSW